MIEKKERREHMRLLYSNTLSYKLWGNNLTVSEQFFRDADILDISTGGVKIRAKALGSNFEVGSVLFFNIPLPKMPVILPVFGKVKWIMPEKQKSCQIGIQFMSSH